MLKEGVHWLWSGDVTIYDMTKQFIPPIELNILLQDEALANTLHVVEVRDRDIVLVYENRLLKQVLTSGRYAFWKGIVEYKFVFADVGGIAIPDEIERTVLQHKLLAPYVRTATVESYEKAVMLVDGKFETVLNSGIWFWWKNSIVINIHKADMRLQQVEINGQEILTKDKAALRINGQAQYKVVDIEKAVLQNKEYEKQLYVTFQLALREYIGGFSFDELLEKKDNIAPYILKAVSEKAVALGIEVTGFGIRDIILPGDVKEIVNQVLIAEKRAQANIIMRREETANTRSLLNTAKLMEDNAMLWKLKEMEYVEKIAEKISNISVNSNGDLIGQLKQIFAPQK